MAHTVLEILNRASDDAMCRLSKIIRVMNCLKKVYSSCRELGLACLTKKSPLSSSEWVDVKNMVFGQAPQVSTRTV